MTLIKNNAKVAAQIAVELAKLQENNNDGDTAPTPSKASTITPLVIGGSILDIHYRVQEDSLEVSIFNYFLE